MVTGIDIERETARLVAVRGRACEPTVRRRSPPSCRCRPGDVARWVRLDLSNGQADGLREAAAHAAVSLDAWLAVMLEYTVALQTLESALGSSDRAREPLSVAVTDRPVMVAALPGWRTWQTYLARRNPSNSDELPEVVLPERLIARGNGDVDVARALSATEDWPLARSCELAACGRGQTLEAFMLHVALT
jgi:hypothetical protein